MSTKALETKKTDLPSAVPSGREAQVAAAKGATGPMCGVALLAAPALKLVWCLFATGPGCLTLDG